MSKHTEFANQIIELASKPKQDIVIANLCNELVSTIEDGFVKKNPDSPYPRYRTPNVLNDYRKALYAITPESHPRILKKYFTTKRTSKGTVTQLICIDYLVPSEEGLADRDKYNKARKDETHGVGQDGSPSDPRTVDASKVLSVAKDLLRSDDPKLIHLGIMTFAGRRSNEIALRQFQAESEHTMLIAGVSKRGGDNWKRFPTLYNAFELEAAIEKIQKTPRYRDLHKSSNAVKTFNSSLGREIEKKYHEHFDPIIVRDVKTEKGVKQKREATHNLRRFYARAMFQEYKRRFPNADREDPAKVFVNAALCEKTDQSAIYTVFSLKNLPPLDFVDTNKNRYGNIEEEELQELAIENTIQISLDPIKKNLSEEATYWLNTQTQSRTVNEVIRALIESAATAKPLVTAAISAGFESGVKNIAANQTTLAQFKKEFSPQSRLNEALRRYENLMRVQGDINLEGCPQFTMSVARAIAKAIYGKSIDPTTALEWVRENVSRINEIHDRYGVDRINPGGGSKDTWNFRFRTTGGIEPVIEDIANQDG